MNLVDQAERREANGRFLFVAGGLLLPSTLILKNSRLPVVPKIVDAVDVLSFVDSSAYFIRETFVQNSVFSLSLSLSLSVSLFYSTNEYIFKPTSNIQTKAFVRSLFFYSRACGVPSIKK